MRYKRILSFILILSILSPSYYTTRVYAATKADADLHDLYYYSDGVISTDSTRSVGYNVSRDPEPYYKCNDHNHTGHRSDLTYSKDYATTVDHYVCDTCHASLSSKSSHNRTYTNQNCTVLRTTKYKCTKCGNITTSKPSSCTNSVPTSGDNSNQYMTAIGSTPSKYDGKNPIRWDTSLRCLRCGYNYIWSTSEYYQGSTQIGCSSCNSKIADGYYYYSYDDTWSKSPTRNLPCGNTSFSSVYDYQCEKCGQSFLNVTSRPTTHLHDVSKACGATSYTTYYRCSYCNRTTTSSCYHSTQCTNLTLLGYKCTQCDNYGSTTAGHLHFSTESGTKCGQTSKTSVSTQISQASKSTLGDYWLLSNGTLTIDLSEDYSFSTPPWESYGDRVIKCSVNAPKCTDISSWCYDFSNCVNFDFKDVSSAKNCSYLFYGCSSATTLPWICDLTKVVTDIGAAYRYCSKLTTIGSGSLEITPYVESATTLFNDSNKLVIDRLTIKSNKVLLVSDDTKAKIKVLDCSNLGAVTSNFRISINAFYGKLKTGTQALTCDKIHLRDTEDNDRRYMIKEDEKVSNKVCGNGVTNASYESNSTYIFANYAYTYFNEDNSTFQYLMYKNLNDNDKDVKIQDIMDFICTEKGYDYKFKPENTSYNTSSAAIDYCNNVSYSFYFTKTPKKFKINFNAGVGSCATSSKDVTYNSAIGDLPTPSAPGRTFTNWTDSSNNIYTSSTIYEVISDTTLYANYDKIPYTISFDSNGGSSCESLTGYVDELYGTLPTPTRKGYTFNGWFDSDGTQITDSSVMVPRDVKLTAHWVANPHTITYDSNGGSSISSVTRTYDEEIGTLPTPTRKGYHLLGWKLGGSYVDSSYKMPDNDITLTAEWEANDIKIVFDANGGSSGTMSPMNIKYDQDVKLTMNQYNKTGYIFRGWSRNKGGSVDFVDGAGVRNISDSGTVTLYAVWEQITYEIGLPTSIELNQEINNPATFSNTLNYTVSSNCGEKPLCYIVGSLNHPTELNVVNYQDRQNIGKNTMVLNTTFDKAEKRNMVLTVSLSLVDPT